LGVCISSGQQCSLVSDYHAKSGFEPVRPDAVLEQVRALTMTTWSYNADDRGVRHMGPVAQEFHQAFGLGDSDRTISTVDGLGVSLAAIQGLADAVDELRAENRALQRENADLWTQVRALRGDRTARDGSTAARP
jgi:hypothetical protein